MPSPHITFLIKGQVNSGKSTLTNAVFARYLSTTSIQCQPNTLIAITDAQHDSEEELEVRNKIVSASQVHVPTAPLEFRIAAKDVLFPRIDGLEYTFIDTPGFGSEDTDRANAAWFHNTIVRADVLFFVTDKAQCIQSVAERNLLVETLTDLRRVQHIKPIPLIILINKVDSAADDSLDEVVQSCRAFVEEQVAKLNCRITVAYCKVSMMNIFLFRTFIANNYSFAGLPQRYIDQLCGDQLGIIGRQQAQDRDRHDALAAQIRCHIESQDWRETSGLSELIKIMHKIVFNKNMLEKMLVSHLHSEASQMHQLNNALGMQNVVAMFREYSRCIDAVRNHEQIPQLDAPCNNEMMQEEEVIDDEISIVLSQNPIRYVTLTDQHTQYQNLYLAAMNRLLETYSLESQVDCKDFLMNFLQSTYDHEDLDNHSLFTAAEWVDKVRCGFVRHMFEICWVPTGIKFGNGTFFPRPNIAFSTEQLIKNTDVMLKCVFSIQGRWASLFQRICCDILPSFISELPLKLRYMKTHDTTYLHYLEQRLLHSIDKENTVIRPLLVALVKAKIQVREHLPGYSVCLQELLMEYPALKQEFFRLFLLVLYAPLPPSDIQFCEDLLKHSDEAKNYQQLILRSDLLVAEQYLAREVCGEEATGKRKHSDIATPMNGQASHETPSRKRLTTPFGQC